MSLLKCTGKKQRHQKDKKKIMSLAQQTLIEYWLTTGSEKSKPRKKKTLQEEKKTTESVETEEFKIIRNTSNLYWVQ